MPDSGVWEDEMDLFIILCEMQTQHCDANCKRSELSGVFNGTDFIYIYMFQAVRRAVNVLNVSTYI